MFANSFVSLLVGGYVCYWVCLFVGWGLMFAIGVVSLLVGGYVCYWVCLFVGLWTCHNIFFISLGMVSVLDCFITELKLSHGF